MLNIKNNAKMRLQKKKKKTLERKAEIEMERESERLNSYNSLPIFFTVPELLTTFFSPFLSKLITRKPSYHMGAVSFEQIG